jgi:glycosyltransferase involved in cell wall biosynthesis
MKKIVLIEPVCRGSRLHWLWLVTKALQDDRDVVVFARSDCETDHFFELMGNLQYTLYKIPCDFEGEWLPTISVRSWWRYLRALLLFDRSQKEPYDLFFLAFDDYIFPLFSTAWIAPFLRMKKGCYTVKYRVACLTAPVGQLRQWLIGQLVRISCAVWKMHCVVLDERSSGAKIGGRRSSWLPDPWFGSFSPDNCLPARQASGYSQEAFVALLIGRQDDRKGFPFMLEALPEALEKIPDLHVLVCGPITDCYQSDFRQLVEHFGARVQHRSDFIPEEQLPFVYAAASVVLMPYAPFFTSTSGVLPRASASGVPVAASEHGLVGDRVRRYPLGVTFPYGNTEAFVRALEQLKSGMPDGLTDGCTAFAFSCSEEAFEVAVRRRILES